MIGATSVSAKQPKDLGDGMASCRPAVRRVFREVFRRRGERPFVVVDLGVSHTVVVDDDMHDAGAGLGEATRGRVSHTGRPAELRVKRALRLRQQDVVPRRVDRGTLGRRSGSARSRSSQSAPSRVICARGSASSGPACQDALNSS